LITGEIHQALQNAWSNDFCKAYIVDGCMYFSKYADYTTRSCDLFRCSIETGEVEQIAGNLLLTGFYDGKLFYETPRLKRSGGQDNAMSPYRYYDIRTEREHEGSREYSLYDELNDGFIVEEASDEVYVSRLTLGFIKKSDYYAGRIENIIFFE
jgi:hypothetical protein